METVELIRDHHGDFHVHAAGCKDLGNTRRYEQYERAHGYAWTFDITSAIDVAEAVYGHAAGSFYEENGGDDTWATKGGYQGFLDSCVCEFQFAPCVKVQS